MSAYSFEVTRTELGSTRQLDLPDIASVDLAEGEAIISVDRFALTANNITYGVAGDLIGYWNFFPPRRLGAHSRMGYWYRRAQQAPRA